MGGYLILFHLFEAKGACRVVADLNEFHSTESSHSQCGDDANIAQLDVSKGVVNPFVVRIQKQKQKQQKKQKTIVIRYHFKVKRAYE